MLSCRLGLLDFLRFLFCFRSSVHIEEGQPPLDRLRCPSPHLVPTAAHALQPQDSRLHKQCQVELEGEVAPVQVVGRRLAVHLPQVIFVQIGDFLSEVLHAEVGLLPESYGLLESDPDRSALLLVEEPPLVLAQARGGCSWRGEGGRFLASCGIWQASSPAE